MALDLTGKRFGRLSVLQRTENDRYGSPRWRCLCDCGKHAIVRTVSLRNGNNRSCGCLQSDVQRARNTTHNKSRSAEYNVWKQMHQRCKNPKAVGFSHYGGRGITVDPAWDQFEQFFADMGEKPAPDYTLERKDNDGPYSATNCTWATRSVQNSNTRRCRWLTFQGRTLLLKDWAIELGIRSSTLTHRLQTGWTLDRALSTPKKRPTD